MAKGRVAHVVSQAGCCHNLPDLTQEADGALGESPHDLLGHIVAKGHAHAGDLEGVGEAVVYEDASREGEHLCLVLQPAEGGWEDETVVVALELRTIVVTFGMTVLLAESFVGYQLLPIHHNGCKDTKIKRISRIILRN